MKKLLLAAMAVLAASAALKAQLPYTLTVQTGQAYAHLTGATSINGTTIWDDDQYGVPMPFSVRIGDKTTSIFYMDLSLGVFLSGATGQVNAFAYDFFTDMVDKGKIDSVASRSPIRFVVNGTAPNRIFKVEMANAGFFNELDTYGTVDDSTNIQMWLYETSNVVELRYGPNSITKYADIYPFFDDPVIGYLGNADADNQTFDKFFNLSGNPANPTIDSIDLQLGNVNPLDSYPANGTVYRFTPKPLGFANGSLAGTALTVFPSVAREVLSVSYTNEARADYRIVSLAGSAVLQGSLDKGTSKLDVSGLAPGTYVLEVQSATGKAARRFSKL